MQPIYSSTGLPPVPPPPPAARSRWRWLLIASGVAVVVAIATAALRAALSGTPAVDCANLADQPLLHANGYRADEQRATSSAPHDLPLPPGTRTHTCSGALMSVFLPIETLVYPGASASAYRAELRGSGWHLVQPATAMTPDEYGRAGRDLRVSPVQWRGALLIMLSPSG